MSLYVYIIIDMYTYNDIIYGINIYTKVSSRDHLSKINGTQSIVINSDIINFFDT